MSINWENHEEIHSEFIVRLIQNKLSDWSALTKDQLSDLMNDVSHLSMKAYKEGMKDTDNLKEVIEDK